MKIIIIILIIVVIIVDKINKEDSDNNTKDDLKMILYGLALFIPILIVNYFLIAILVSCLLAYTTKSQGVWAFGMILGIIGSPILTSIIVRKILLKIKNKLVNKRK